MMASTTDSKKRSGKTLEGKKESKKSRNNTKNHTKKNRKTKDILEKDEEEIALEKIVFGDVAGFESSLRHFDLDSYLEDLNQQNMKDELGSDEEEDFGSDQDNEEDDEDLAALDDADLFVVDEPNGDNQSNSEGDSDSDSADDDDSDTSLSEEDPNEILDVNGGTAAWIDSDDERLQVSLANNNRLKKLRKNTEEDYVSGREYAKRLRSRFEKVYPVPKWAKESKKEYDSDGDDMDLDTDDDEGHSSQQGTNPLKSLLQNAARYVSTKKTKMLPATHIDIERLQDANQSAPSLAVIQDMNFHPTHPLLLTCGFDQTLRIYHIDGKKNPLVSSLHVRRLPFKTAHFHPDGVRVLAGGVRKNLRIWDIDTGNVAKVTNLYGHEDTQPNFEKFKISPCGKHIALIGELGWMNMLSARNAQWVAGAKVDDAIVDLVWTHDGSHVIMANSHGDVWEWDVKTRQFTSRWRDEGGIGICKLALGGKGDRWLAVGSNNGVVNIYDRKALQGSGKETGAFGEPLMYKPKAVIKHLITAVSALEFSPDGQILAIASDQKQNALKLIHIPSFTAFSNWPTSNTPLGKVTTVAFTPGGEMISVANQQGRARLWRLNHYV